MQIHHLDVVRRESYVFDAEFGVVRRQEEAIRCSTVERIVYDGKTYEVQPDGSFEVPDDVGEFMLRDREHWHPGPSPFADELLAATRSKEPAVKRVSRPASA